MKIMRAKNFHKHHNIDPTEDVEDIEEIENEIYNEREEREMEKYYNEKY